MLTSASVKWLVCLVIIHKINGKVSKFRPQDNLYASDCQAQQKNWLVNTCWLHQSTAAQNQRYSANMLSIQIVSTFQQWSSQIKIAGTTRTFIIYNNGVIKAQYQFLHWILREIQYSLCFTKACSHLIHRCKDDWRWIRSTAQKTYKDELQTNNWLATAFASTLIAVQEHFSLLSNILYLKITCHASRLSIVP